jgi:pSer/pThr/pTyr-binding forkhead associated (FHA) protein
MAETIEARVWLSEGDQPPRSIPLPADGLLVGRAEHCDLVLDDEAVSADHLEIATRGLAVMATDLDSRNGTLLNGERLDRPRRLRNGDVLQLGRNRLELALPPQSRRESTVVAPPESIQLTEDERKVARALVAPYREPGVRAGRPATRAEIAESLHLSERTVQRRMDALAGKLSVPAEEKRERPRLVAERVLQLGLDHADPR